MGNGLMMYNGHYLGYNGSRLFFPSVTAGSTLLNGLIAYWKMDDLSTGVVVDSLGLYNGSTNALQNQTGKLGTCCSFDGTKEVSMGLSANLKPTSSFSIAGWWKQYLYQGVMAGVGIKNIKGWYLGSAPTTGLARFVSYNGNENSVGYSTTPITTYTPDTWFHIAATVDASVAQVYINGVLEGSVNLAYGISCDPDSGFRLGHSDVVGGYSSGWIDEVGYWNRALTSTELAELYNEGVGKTYPFTNVVAPAFLSTDGSTAAWYRYDVPSTLTRTDSSVSQWNDYLGSGRNLESSTNVSTWPKYNSDGLLFDGVNDYLKTQTFSYVVPESVYIVFKQITWTANDRIFDGSTLDSGSLYQAPVSPALIGYYGAVGVYSYDLSLNTFGIVRTTYNGASSKIQVNNYDASIGRAGFSVNMNGFTLARRGDLASASGNIQVKEIILRRGIDSTVNETAIYNYLATKYNIT